MKEAAEGVMHLHQRGWVHGDAYNNNILLNEVEGPAGGADMEDSLQVKVRSYMMLDLVLWLVWVVVC